MLQSAFIFLFILASAAFQVSYLPHIFPSESVPDFLLILILFWVMRLDFFRILFWIILSGLVMDAASLSPLGLHVISFIAVAFFADYLAKKIIVVQENRRFFISLGLLVSGTFLNDWILIGLGGIIKTGSLVQIFGLFFGESLFLKILCNLLVLALIYWPMVKLSNFFSFYSARINAIK